MTFLETLTEIKTYLAIEGAESEAILKGFINDAVLDFCRAYDWARLKVNDTITLDGSNSYALDNTILSSTFHRELNLILPYASTNTTDVTKYTKYNYENYLRLADKSYCWAIFGTNIYITGNSGDLNFFYISPGDFDNYPLTDDGDEVPALIYYPDIIKHITVISYLDFIGDAESVGREEQTLQKKLIITKSGEKRGEHHGKWHHIRRGGLG